MNLSIVVPIYNEAENLHALVAQVENAMLEGSIRFWELILVNDGSTDGSGELIDHLAQRCLQVVPVHLDRNHGQTAAFAAGFSRAIFDLILTMDGDLQNDPADVQKLLAGLGPGIGCVCGVRVKRRDSWLRRVSSKLANRVRNYLSQDSITDTGCSLKLFRSESLKPIKFFEGMHRFLPTLVRMEGFDVVEVAVNHRPRLWGKSKYGIANRALRSFLDLLAVRWMKWRRLDFQIKEDSLGTCLAKHDHSVA